MILLAFLAVAADPEPLSLDPFMDEEAAAHALEDQMACLAGGAFDHRIDTRDAKAIAADVVQTCGAKAAVLQQALTDVYRRKPALLHDGLTAETAAKAYVIRMNSSVESVIIEGRKHN